MLFTFAEHFAVWISMFELRKSKIIFTHRLHYCVNFPVVYREGHTWGVHLLSFLGACRNVWCSHIFEMPSPPCLLAYHALSLVWLQHLSVNQQYCPVLMKNHNSNLPSTKTHLEFRLQASFEKCVPVLSSLISLPLFFYINHTVLSQRMSFIIFLLLTNNTFPTPGLLAGGHVFSIPKWTCYLISVFTMNECFEHKRSGSSSV